MIGSFPSSIAVEGPIGVGKTTLARSLADRLEMRLLLEQAEENPFLPEFYRQPERMALATQLYFLFQRSRQLRTLQQPDMFRPRGWVSDFVFAKDQIFARQNLDREEYRLYRKVCSLMVPVGVTPELVIYLHAPSAVLHQRISRRGIPYEQRIPREYLDRLCEAYVEHFHYYEDTPLLVVNVADCDLTMEHEFERLLEKIPQYRQGRHYFNPGRLL